MSEYQYYEFLAVDRPLTDREQAEVRLTSSRAMITATSFTNEYHWGDYGGDPRRLMERYYDAHLYVANWGTHQVMFRLPRALLELEAAQAYCAEDGLTAWATDKFVLLDFTSEDESGDFDYDAEGSLSAIIGVRAELAVGDLRPLYLGWLAARARWELHDDDYDPDPDSDFDSDFDNNDREPPVPPGLGKLTAAQRALADFLRLDDNVIATAAETSLPLEETATDSHDLTAWVAHLPEAEKNQLLTRVMRDEGARVRLELLGRFRNDTAPATPPGPARRTVRELFENASQRLLEHERRLAAHRAEAKARRERERLEERERQLNELAGDEEAAWTRVEAMIGTRKPAEYDAATALLTILKALAERERRHDAFTSRTTELRRTHARKPSLIKRFDEAGI